jgi:hypothetical protein
VAAITAAQLALERPHLETAVSDNLAMVDQTIAKVNAMAFPLYTDDDEDTDRRLNEACARLWIHPFGRPIGVADPSADNPWVTLNKQDDRSKGANNPVPHWPDIDSGAI